MGRATKQIATVYRFRLKDRHASDLGRQAEAVNTVWNFCNETQQKAARLGRPWLTAVDLQRLTAGASQEVGLHAHTIQKVAQQYDRSRRQHRRAWLKWRTKKSLGWVPFNKGHVKIQAGTLRFNGRDYTPMHWREFPEGAVILGGSFSQDARGRWYINCPVEVPSGAEAPKSVVGIDLGLKDLATLSTGEKIENPKHFYVLADKLGKAQRARKKGLARTIAAKIANCRKDHLHKASARIALAHDLIFVGNVSSTSLARTRLGKSVKDASWSTLRTQLSYKAIRHGGRMIEVDERLTTQACSSCGCLPEGRPEGIAGLRIRRWICCECGAEHDRDVNAAINIARFGLKSLEEGTAI